MKWSTLQETVSQQSLKKVRTKIQFDVQKNKFFSRKKSFEPDLFFDWDNLDRSGIAENQMSINELSIEKICQPEFEKAVPVKIGIKLGYVLKVRACKVPNL